MDSRIDDWPRLLDAHYSTFDEDLPFWISLAERFGTPVLELGCGPGRVCFALAQHGYDVTGLDNNAAMLARARRRTPSSLEPHTHFIEGDLRNFTLSERYRLVLIPCNTFAGLTESDAADCLASAQRHLHPGGALAIEVPSPHETLTETPDETEPITEFFETEAGRPVQVYARQTFDPVERRLDVEWRYDELLSDGKVLRTVVPAVYYLRSAQALAALLRRAGFARVSRHGDYACGPLLVTSERMLLIAET